MADPSRGRRTGSDSGTQRMFGFRRELVSTAGARSQSAAGAISCSNRYCLSPSQPHPPKHASSSSSALLDRIQRCGRAGAGRSDDGLLRCRSTPPSGVLGRVALPSGPRRSEHIVPAAGQISPARIWESSSFKPRFLRERSPIIGPLHATCS
jgi:hypothetical protein